MRVEEIHKLTRRELRSRADVCFTRAEFADDSARPGFLLEAQFYMRELEQRTDSRTSLRDLILEIIVIGLIGWEIFLGIRQERQQTMDFASRQAEFSQQQQVLTNLQASSASTATTLAMLESTSELMNQSLQKQVALFYDVSIIPVYDEGQKRLNIVNSGRTGIVLWGLKLADQKPDIDTEGRTVSPNSTYSIDAKKIVEAVITLKPKGTDGLVPFEIYLKNERGEEFTQNCRFAVMWDDKDTPKIGVQVVSITPEHWSKATQP
jgi:hypothetical protein